METDETSALKSRNQNRLWNTSPRSLRATSSPSGPASSMNSSEKCAPLKIPYHMDAAISIKRAFNGMGADMKAFRAERRRGQIRRRVLLMRLSP